MKRFAFVSRHQPTSDQVRLAAESDIELVPVGDRDGFTMDLSELDEFDGVVVVHAAAAMRCLAAGFPVGVFTNINRAEVGQPPRFETTALHIYVVVNCFPDEGYKFTLAIS